MKCTSWELAQVKSAKKQKFHPALYAYCLPSDSVRDEHSDDAWVLKKMDDQRRKQLQIKETTRKCRQIVSSDTQDDKCMIPTLAAVPSPSIREARSSSNDFDQCSDLAEEVLQEARNALKLRCGPLPLRGHTMKRRLIRRPTKFRKTSITSKKMRLTGSQQRAINSMLKDFNTIEGDITVKTITGLSFSVPFCPGASVASLKVVIEVCRDIPKRAQHLYFNNQHLSDACTLGHYNIRPENEIWLIPELAASGEVSAATSTNTESAQTNKSTYARSDTDSDIAGRPDDPVCFEKSESKSQTKEGEGQQGKTQQTKDGMQKKTDPVEKTKENAQHHKQKEEENKKEQKNSINKCPRSHTIETRLKELCLSKNVVYQPPDMNETKHKKYLRRRKLRNLCDPDMCKKIKDKDAKRKREERRTMSRENKDKDAKRKREEVRSQEKKDKDSKRKREEVRSQEKKDKDSKRKREERSVASREEKDKDANRKRKERHCQKERHENLYTCPDLFNEYGVPQITVEIKESMRKAQECIKRTEVAGHPNYHKALVCIVCDAEITGTSPVYYVNKETIMKHKDRLSVQTCEEHCGIIDPLLIKQYEVEGFPGFLLSPRCSKRNGTFATCSHCHSGLSYRNEGSDSPIKYWIGNDLVIGHIPEKIMTEDDDGTLVEEHITSKDDKGRFNVETGDRITPLICAAIAPIRPHAYIFSYQGGFHQTIKGNFQFFEADQTKLISGMNKILDLGGSPDIYIVLCGAMTPAQKTIVRQKKNIDTTFYKRLIRWFKAHHPGFKYKDLDPPEIHLLEDTEKPLNTDMEGDPKVETRCEEGVFYFTSGNDPRKDTSIYKTTRELALAILENRSAPALVIKGGRYATHNESSQFENVMPIQFPFGSGGPKRMRKTPISEEELLRHYLRLSLSQFKKSDFIFLANHTLRRIISYKSAIVKCRPILGSTGVSLGERIADMTVDDVREAIKEDEERHKNYKAIKADTNDAYSRSQSVGAQFLRQVSSSCRAYGTSKEAAEYARRKCFALQDYFGMHSLFLTITPADDCCFRIRLYVNADRKHELTQFDCTKDKLLYDMKLREDQRKKYPGACAQEYHSAVQIVLEHLFGWDEKKQRGRPGILGTLQAFCEAIEEQGRGTLHGHFLIWVANFALLRKMLHDKNEAVRESAKREYVKYIDKVMSARHGNFSLDKTAQCMNCETSGDIDGIFNNRESSATQKSEAKYQPLRDARHKTKCHDISGKVMQCSSCSYHERPTDIVEGVLKKLNNDLGDNVPIPLPDELLDVAAYRFVYDADFDKGPENCTMCCGEKQGFWDDPRARIILLRLCFDEHCYKHARSCFKKGCECRFFFPFMAQPNETRVFNDPSRQATLFYTLDGDQHERYGFVVELKRPQACQYMNTHSDPISFILNCNTNVQTGDWAHCFYQTFYQSKVTMKDDCEPRDLVLRSVSRRILRAQDAARAREAAGETSQQCNEWLEGLSRLLSGINAASSRTVVSAPMAASLVMKRGERFIFSHEFAELLLGQIEAVLHQESVTFICRKCTNSLGKQVQWSDVSANDYLFRPKSLESLCYAEQVTKYRKAYKQKQQLNMISTGTHTRKVSKNEVNLSVKEGHPGYGYAYLEKNLHDKIPLVSIPDGHLCQVKDLQLGCSKVADDVKLKRERYAKTSLLLFHPFRCLEDLQTNGEFWPTFDNCRKTYFQLDSEGDDNDPGNTVVSPTQFWEKGFKILDNIEERMTISKNNQRTMDELTLTTNFHNEEGESGNNKDDNNDDDVPDISFFCNGEDCSDDDLDPVEDDRTWKYSSKSLIIRKNASDDKLIDARMSSTNSVLYQEKNSNREESEVPKNDGGNVSRCGTRWEGFESFDVVMKLVSGTLLGGAPHAKVYANMKSDGNEEEEMGFSSIDLSTSVSGRHEKFTAQIPTLEGVARMVAREEGKTLDEKQYVMYEVLSCTFLLQLVSKHSIDGVTAFEKKMRSALGVERKKDMDQLEELLKKRGARDQLIMFVTGLAGSGKSTGINVAQRFCFEFCRAASIMWEDNTFLFTAYTGSAAAAFGGLTTCSATFLCKSKIEDKDRDKFHGVRIIIIDEVSFLKKSELKKLMSNLQDLGDPHSQFGGYNVVFGGDFQQLKPINVPLSELLWHPSSGREFESFLNCAIVLEGTHRFKDDKWYGDMLKRICSGEITQDDIDRINSRVVGSDGLRLPKTIDGNTCYACPCNDERNAITAAIFKRHVHNTHPTKESTALPPPHTIIIEADIKPREGSNEMRGFTSLRRRILELGDGDVRTSRHVLVDPCLRLYMGAYFMCNSNDGLEEKGTANGTQCRVIAVKLKDNPQSYMWKVWDNHKVWTVHISDVEWVEFEHFPKTHDIVTLELMLKQKMAALHKNNPGANRADIESIERKLRAAVKARTFRLKPQTFNPVNVKVAPSDLILETVNMKCAITQVPVNSSDAITGNKLQGLTKDNLIVYSWNKNTNWIYVVLSRVRTLKGLYLMKRLKLSDIKPPSADYLDFMSYIKKLEQDDLQRFRQRHCC